MFLKKEGVKSLILGCLLLFLLSNSASAMQLSSCNQETWDWRDVNGVDWTTPIRDQIQDECGSCWAFGALGGLESAYKIWMNNANMDVDFSEQFILSCSPGSCNGWYLSRTLGWIQHNGMIDEECMPYLANDTIPCNSKCDDWRDHLFGISEYTRLPRGDINAIQQALITYGPLPATMMVYSDFYPIWDGSVYRQESDEVVFGHVITIVGFDNTWGSQEEGYWICKNSWGTNWGEKGWFRIAYGECDIEDGVYYLEGLNHPPNKPTKIQGSESGKPYVNYVFSSTCIDVDGDDLFYLFDWGDGNDSGWLGPYNQSTTVSANYSWKAKGIYEVKVKTRDMLGRGVNDYGLESDWSDPLEITLPKSKPYVSFLEEYFPILFNFFSSFKN